MGGKIIHERTECHVRNKAYSIWKVHSVILYPVLMSLRTKNFHKYDNDEIKTKGYDY